MEKKCVTCAQEKALEDFHADKRMKDGYANECRRCKKARSRRNWKANNPYDPVQERTRRLKKKYNITPEEYDVMYEEQGGMCAICAQELSERPHIDHCHNSLIVRGLLCGTCNTGLGMFKDNQDYLLAAVEYLKKSSVVFQGLS